MSKNDGGAAFPESVSTGYNTSTKSNNTGMSLRDWFAGQGLAVLADGSSFSTHDEKHFSRIALYAYRVADAMLAEREKKAGNTT